LNSEEQITLTSCTTVTIERESHDDKVDRNGQRHIGHVKHDKHWWTEFYFRVYKRLYLSAARRQPFHTRLCDAFVA